MTVLRLWRNCKPDHHDGSDSDWTSTVFVGAAQAAIKFALADAPTSAESAD
jgi:hypothetical protein